MEIIILLIGISLSIAIGFLVVFIWNIRSGQYEDTLTPSLRMLFENTKNGRESAKTELEQDPDKTQGLN